MLSFDTGHCLFDIGENGALKQIVRTAGSYQTGKYPLVKGVRNGLALLFGVAFALQRLEKFFLGVHQLNRHTALTQD